MARTKRYPNLEKARAAKAAKHNTIRKLEVEFPLAIQVLKRINADGWLAQGELTMEGGTFLVRGFGDTPENALWDMRESFNALPFAAKY